jgi:hypothetical protein
MNPFRSLQTAVICLIALAVVTSLVFLAQGGRPSDALIKVIITKQMEKRLKGGSIVSMKIVRGAPFSNEAHYSKVPYGTRLYPVVVNLTYNTKLPDGSISENKDLSRTLNFYKDTSHQWVNDDELH